MESPPDGIDGAASGSAAPPHIGVVIPVYGCAALIGTLCSRLENALATVTDAYEIVLVDDCGPDHAWPGIVAEATRNPRIRGIRLSRNFGQHAAIAAGVAHTSADWIVVLDCDLQDPPEVIPALYAQALQGAEIVFARRRRAKESLGRRLVSRAYFRVLNAMSDTVIDGRDGALSMFSRRVAAEYVAMADQDRHHVMLLRWLGFGQSVVEYDRAERGVGRSSYRLSTLIDSAIAGLLFSSTRLLKVIVASGAAFAGAGFVIAAGLLVLRFTTYTAPGWTSMIVTQLVVGGVIIVSVGMVGMYVGRIFDRSRHRPLYIIERETSSEARSRKAAAR